MSEQKQNNADELLTVNEVSLMLRVDPTTVRRWIAKGVLEAVTLPHVRKRKAHRIKRSVIDRMLHPDRP